MEYKVAVIKGDGIGPEIVTEAMGVLEAVAVKFSHSFIFTQVLMGGAAIDATGVPLPDETIAVCKASDSVLLGAVGGPKWETLPGHLRPEAGLLGIRAALALYANLRPAILYPELSAACPLKPEIAGGNLDIMMVRELTGGLYFGERGRRAGKYGSEAYDSEVYSEMEVERIVRLAFDIARKRGKKLHSIDKANVLESSRLWREVAHRVATDYPDVEILDMLVDNCAMQLIRNPHQFDTVVTSNLFGDILSDEASMITGSIGMLPSASLGNTTLGLYEPIHGSAPDIAGQNRANPIATILSCAMMLRHSFSLTAEADAIERSVKQALAEGYRTGDINGNGEGTKLVGTQEMGKIIKERI